MLERVSEGKYIFGKKTVDIKIIDGELMASDGDNFIKFTDFLETQGIAEI